jgi:UDP-N-acetylglucosamine--N-acetylmuramyl-(pentapeptide) pyrophosphoryl-undecaprenol N-acetylglucosamine transferase
MRVVVAGGGTAGHVNPALALAEALEPDSVTFVGTRLGAEATLVPAAGRALETIEVRGFDRSRPASIFPTGVVAARAVRSAGRLLRRLEPDAVVGMGGYVSLPVCLAARAARIPIVIHEQNIVFGLANRVCKPLAHRVAVSFAETLPAAGRRGVLVGNPVARDLIEARGESCRRRGLTRFSLEGERKTLLVFGGSQGARRINEAGLALARLWHDRSDRQVLHIAGRSAGAAKPGAGGEGALVYRMVDYVARMVEAYAVADLALCRGGATTVAELGAAALPAIVVPYPYHRDLQQERHGRVLERAGAAIVMADSDATGGRVARAADDLLGDMGLLARMREAAAARWTPDAAERLAGVVRGAAA